MCMLQWTYWNFICYHYHRKLPWRDGLSSLDATQASAGPANLHTIACVGCLLGISKYREAV